MGWHSGGKALQFCAVVQPPTFAASLHSNLGPDPIWPSTSGKPGAGVVKGS